jgi:regulator of RNase E activity RraA
MSHDSRGPDRSTLDPDVHARRPGTPGARLRSSWDRPDKALVRGLGELSTGVIGDAMHRLGAMNGTIRPFWPGARLAGPALTVWVRVGDSYRIHEAIAMASPGDVLVVNANGSAVHAVFGELMALASLARGIAGVVVDGSVRDVAALIDLQFPVFATSVCASGPLKDGTGEIGYPVACGGVVCAVGDIVVADADGVVVVPSADAGGVLDQARRVKSWETQRRADLVAEATRTSPLRECGT